MVHLISSQFRQTKTEPPHQSSPTRTRPITRPSSTPPVQGEAKMLGKSRRSQRVEPRPLFEAWISLATWSIEGPRKMLLPSSAYC
ncbi:hypothetical protein Leryth_013094 [Lithospermum erythrorhizon]|nr:hypothetical protein Leryth_013094 [Lithospermum erythrorhizon]